MDFSQLSPNYVIPVGTQVLLKRAVRVLGPATESGGQPAFKKAGSVGVVVEAPLTREYRYLVRFADDVEVRAKHAMHLISIRSPKHRRRPLR